jgi:hypothetical protein
MPVLLRLASFRCARVKPDTFFSDFVCANSGDGKQLPSLAIGRGEQTDDGGARSGINVNGTTGVMEPPTKFFFPWYGFGGRKNDLVRCP